MPKLQILAPNKTGLGASVLLDGEPVADIISLQFSMSATEANTITLELLVDDIEVVANNVERKFIYKYGGDKNE